MVSPVRSNVAWKPLSGSVVTNKRGGLSAAFLCCIPPGAITVALAVSSTGIGETWAVGPPGGSIIVASRATSAGVGETVAGGLPGVSIIVASAIPCTCGTLADNATGD